MITATQILAAARLWVELAMASTAADGRVVVYKRGAPRPARPYATVQISSLRSRGRDEWRWTDDSGVNDLVGTRDVTVTVSVYGADALSLAERARAYLRLQAAQDVMRDAGVIVRSATPTRNVAIAIDTGWEERVEFDALLSVAQERTQVLGYFDKVDIEGAINDVDGTTELVAIDQQSPSLSATTTTTTVTLAWNEIEDAITYDLFWSTSSPVTVDSSSFTGLTDLTYVHTPGTAAGTLLYYVVRVRTTYGTSGLSPELTTGLRPAAPVLTVTPGELLNVITWPSITGATSYRLFWSTLTGVDSESGWAIVGATSPYYHGGLLDGVTYYYTARAYIGDIYSADATEASGVPFDLVDAPENVSATANSSTQITITWDASVGAISYDLFWSTTSPVTLGSNTVAGVTSPYAHTGRTPGTTYYYRLTASSDTDTSDLSSEASALTLCSAPSLSIESGDEQLTLTWSAVTGAASYNLYWSTLPGVTSATGTPIVGVTSPYVHTGRTNDVVYYYVATAINASGASADSAQVSETPVSGVPDAPTALVATPRTNALTVDVSWNSVPEATSYDLYFSTTSPVTTGSTKISGVTSPYAHTGRSPNVTYYYAAVAVNPGGESDLSNEDSALTVPSNVSGLGVDLVPRENELGPYWDAVTGGAASYTVFWSTSTPVTTGDNAITGITDLYYQHTGRSANQTYYYAVKAVNATGSSISLSNEGSGKTPPAPPTAVAVPVEAATSVSISWDAAAGANNYYLYWDTNPTVAFTDNVITEVTSPYVHTGRTPNVTYYYRLSAFGATTEESPLGTEDSALTVTAAPGSFDAAPVANALSTSITWASVSGAASYNLYFDTSSGITTADTKITGVTSPYTHTGRSANTTYWYRVEAINSEGKASPLSTEDSALVVPAAPTISRTIGTGVVTLSWSAVTGATSYDLYWATSSPVTTGSTKISGVTSSYAHTGRSNGTAYYYALVANNASGESPLSNEVNGTPLAAPTGVSATGGDAKITVSWSAVTGATSYNIYHKATTGVTTGDTQIAGVTSPYDYTIADGTIRYFKVEAVNAGGVSDLSSEVNATSNTIQTSATLLATRMGIATAPAHLWAFHASGNVTSIGTTGGITVVPTGFASNPPTPAAITNLNGMLGVTFVSADDNKYQCATNVPDYGDQSVTMMALGTFNDSAVTSYVCGKYAGTQIFALDLYNGSGGSYEFRASTAPAVSRTHINQTLDGEADAVICVRNTTTDLMFVHSSTGVSATSAFTNTISTDSPMAMGSLNAATSAGMELALVAIWEDAAAEQNFTNAANRLLTAIYGAPSAPAGVRCAGGDTKTATFWTSDTGVASYNLYWATSSPVTTGSTKITGVTSPYVHTGRSNGTTYYYAVEAVGTNGTSSLSSEVSATCADPYASAANMTAAMGLATAPDSYWTFTESSNEYPDLTATNLDMSDILVDEGTRGEWNAALGRYVFAMDGTTGTMDDYARLASTASYTMNANSDFAILWIGYIDSAGLSATARAIIGTNRYWLQSTSTVTRFYAGSADISTTNISTVPIDEPGVFICKHDNTNNAHILYMNTGTASLDTCADAMGANTVALGIGTGPGTLKAAKAYHAAAAIWTGAGAQQNFADACANLTALLGFATS